SLTAHLLPDLVCAIRLIVLAPNALDDRDEHLIPDGARGPFRRIRLAGLVPEVRRRGDRHLTADRLDPMRGAVLVDEGDHHFGRRSSSACAKYADALRRISFARFGSTTS